MGVISSARPSLSDGRTQELGDLIAEYKDVFMRNKYGQTTVPTLERPADPTAP
jgi:hypothetical protein